MTSAFMISAEAWTVTDVLIEDNLIRGRTSKYIHIPGAGANIRLVNNKMGRENRDYPRMFSINADTGTLVTGNVAWDLGTPANY